MTDADPAQPPPRFRALLRPNRSLTPVGFKVLMGFVIFVNVAVGVAFWMLGAWPVFGFCGLDVAAIYWAFKINYREAGLTEQIEIGHADLSLVRTHPSGASERFELNPYWARVRLEEFPSGTNALSIGSHGKELSVGTFLSPEERRELAVVLQDQLQAVRTSGSPAA